MVSSPVQFHSSIFIINLATYVYTEYFQNLKEVPLLGQTAERAPRFHQILEEGWGGWQGQIWLSQNSNHLLSPPVMISDWSCIYGSFSTWYASCILREHTLLGNGGTENQRGGTSYFNIMVRKVNIQFFCNNRKG